jgi:hypothetical protein
MTRIYKITDITNNKIYIGQTSRSLEARFRDHKSKAVTSNRPNDLNCKLYQAMRKNGTDNFTIELLEEFDGTRFKADQQEIYWIATLNSTDPEIGYNTDKGGHVISEACRKARIKQLTGSKLEGERLEIVRANGMKKAKIVCQYDVKTGELIGEYPSIIGASRLTGCDRRTIQRQLKGEANTGTPHSISNLKYIWKYKEEAA